MSSTTLTALYQTRQDAEAARDRLSAAGIGGDVDIHDNTDRDGAAPTGGTLGAAGSQPSLMDKIAAFFGGHDDTHTYHEGVLRGHYLLTVRVEELAAERAAEILDATNAVDLDTAQESWRGEGWKPPAGSAERGEFAARREGTDIATTPHAAEEEVIPLAEERLKLGKRLVERGGVRVRAYVVETPVHEQVTLREEHVSVERRAVDRPLDRTDEAFQERNLEFTESAEEAVIAKEAVIREELIVRKDSSERVQHVDDTVRRTEVDIDDGIPRGDDRDLGRTPR